MFNYVENEDLIYRMPSEESWFMEPLTAMLCRLFNLNEDAALDPIPIENDVCIFNVHTRTLTHVESNISIHWSVQDELGLSFVDPVFSNYYIPPQLLSNVCTDCTYAVSETPWAYTIRRSHGLIEHIDHKGQGHPALGSVAYLTEFSEQRGEEAAYGMHGCGGACSTFTWKQRDAWEGWRLARRHIKRMSQKLERVIAQLEKCGDVSYRKIISGYDFYYDSNTDDIIQGCVEANKVLARQCVAYKELAAIAVNRLNNDLS